MALSSTSQEEIRTRELNIDMENEESQPTFIFDDDQSAIAMAKNLQHHGRLQNINIKFHFVRELVSNGTLLFTCISCFHANLKKRQDMS